MLDGVGLNHTRHKLVPDGNGFKLVFISSDSSKESDNLNSSMEGANSPDEIKSSATISTKKEEKSNLLSNKETKNGKPGHRKYPNGEFDCIATSSPKGGRCISKTPPKLPPKNLLKGGKSPKIGRSPNSSGASSMEMDHSKSHENGLPNKISAPAFMIDHDFHHYDTGLIGAGSCSSPSINTIRTAATRDIDSPVSSKKAISSNFVWS